MNLIPEEVIQAAQERSANWRERLPGKYNGALMEDPRFGRALLVYLFLTESADVLPAETPPVAIFWSRYYWFKRFLHTYHGRGEGNVGMEQQAFQILEYPWPPCEPDWADLEAVDLAATEAAARDLRSPSVAPAKFGDYP